MSHVVTTSLGKIEGFKNENSGQYCFFGIPYAEPPIGALRFKPTQPKNPWDGIFKATHFGFAGPQKFDPTEGAYHEFTDDKNDPANIRWVGHENNLTLNIWTPGCDNKKRSVLVWIHGGANWLESSRLATYHGDSLVANGDVVFVSINYRLGVFGWLDVSVLGGADYAGSHSNGLMDQLTALKWIKQNIGQFGGDAENITIMGESAGSINISWLLTNGHLNGIAKRVVMMSGVAGLIGLSGDLTQGFGDAYAQQESKKFLNDIKINSWEQLEKMSTADIMQRVVDHADTTDMLCVMDSQFWPRHGHPLTKQDPFRAAKEHGSHGIDVMIGYTSYEMGLWLFWDDTLDQRPSTWAASRIIDFDAQKAAEAVKIYAEIFPGETSGVQGMHMIGDAIFVLPTLWFADQVAANGNNIWMYQFDRSSNPRQRALHAADQTYLFNKHETQAGLSLLGAPKDATENDQRKKLTRQMQTAVLSFAKTGDPNTLADGLPRWPKYTADARSVMNFDFVSEIKDDVTKPRREWWYRNIYEPALNKNGG